uniref:Uncharacterized protein n=1 Tax=Solanum lycopersicum TaxID=4081 RepID=A0A3Q7JNG6_SOLLC
MIRVKGITRNARKYKKIQKFESVVICQQIRTSKKNETMLKSKLLRWVLASASLVLVLILFMLFVRIQLLVTNRENLNVCYHYLLLISTRICLKKPIPITFFLEILTTLLHNK